MLQSKEAKNEGFFNGSSSWKAVNSTTQYFAFPVSLKKAKNKDLDPAVTFVFAAIKTSKKVTLIPLLCKLLGQEADWEIGS